MKNFYKGTIVLFITAIISALLNFFFYNIADFITVEEFGIFISLLQLIYIVGLLQNALMNYMTKLVATKDMTSKEINSKSKSIAKAQVIMTIIFVPIGMLFAKYVFKLEGIWEIVALIPYLMTSLLISLHRGILRGREKFVNLGWINIVEAGLKLIMGLTAAYLGYGVIGIFLAIGITEIVIYLLLVILTKESPKNEDLSKADQKGVFNEKIFGPTAIAFILLNIIFVVDGLLARYNLNSDTAGLYGGLITFGRLVFFLANTVVIAMFPFAVKSKDSRNLLSSATLIVVLLTGAISIGYYLLGGFVINLVLGGDYSIIARYLPVEAMIMGIYTLISVIVTYLISKNMSNLNWILFIGIVGLTVVLLISGDTLVNMLLIRGIGYSVILAALIIWAIISFKNKNYVL